jgi:hypothetical protein
MRVSRRLALAVVVSAAGLPPSSAVAAPTLQTDKPCYTPGESITFTGGGYTAGGDVNFFFSLMGENGSKLLSGRAPAIADAAGAISQVFAAPPLASSDDTRETIFTTANDATLLAGGGPPEEGFGHAEAQLSVFDVWVNAWEGDRVDPRGKTKISAYGYEPAKQLWAHYVLHGKRVKSVLVGSLTGPCGDLTKTIRQFPFRPVPAGTYAVYFQGSKTLNKRLGTPYSKVRVDTAAG